MPTYSFHGKCTKFRTTAPLVEQNKTTNLSQGLTGYEVSLNDAKNQVVT